MAKRDWKLKHFDTLNHLDRLSLIDADASTDPARRRGMMLRTGLLLLWLAVELFMVSRHVMWRDEVRGFSLALQGNGIGEMLVGLRGEGHPALWYLILRGLHELWPHREVLPAAAFILCAGAMAVLTWRAPFRPVAIALVLFSGFGLYEYGVMARNYGVAMLLLFLLAALYGRARGGLVLMPLLLFLLCNSNVHAVLLAGGILLVLYTDIAADRGWIAALGHRTLLVSALATMLGVAACYGEVSLPLQNAVHLAGEPVGLERLPLLPRGLIWPGRAFGALDRDCLLGGPVLMSVLLWLSLAGLAFRPGLLAAGLSVQIGMSVLFELVYPGDYRHAALYIVFLLTLYWLAAEGFGGRWPVLKPRTAAIMARLHRIGCIALPLFLLLQLQPGIASFLRLATGQPESSGAAMGALLARPDLRDAIVMGDPDYHLETLAYYAANPTWFVREGRCGRVVHFRRDSRLDISLGDVLASARSIAGRTGRPIVILLADPIDTVAGPVVWKKGYVWTLSATPKQVRDFRSATRFLQRFSTGTNDENYAAYLLPAPSVKAAGTLPADCTVSRAFSG